MESAGADLSIEYHNFSEALLGAEIFEIKVSPLPFTFIYGPLKLKNTFLSPFIVFNIFFLES